MTETEKNRRPATKTPWFLIVALVVTVYIFWVLPIQLGPRAVRVEAADARGTR